MRLVQAVSSSVGRPLQEPEMEYLLSELKKEDTNKFASSPYSEVLKLLSRKYTERLQALQCKAPLVNMKEYMLNEMNDVPLGAASNTMQRNTRMVQSAFASDVSVSNFFGMRSMNELMRFINPEQAKKFATVILNSQNRVIDSTSNTYFKWNYSNSTNVDQGSFNSIHLIRNITAIRLCDIRLPLADGLDTDTRRVTMLIGEYSSTGSIGPNNRNYHFMFGVERDNNYVELKTFGFNDGYFRFISPASLSSLTISFANPFNLITFDPDRTTCTLVQSGKQTVFQTAIDHRLLTGDLVFLRGFTTLNDTRHSLLLSSINTDKGHEIVRVSDNQFSIAVDSSAVNVAGLGTVTIAQNDTTVTGIGTNFTSLLTTSDYITIGLTQFKVVSIASNTQLTVEVPSPRLYANFNWSRNNQSSEALYAILDSKSFFIQMEIEFYG